MPENDSYLQLRANLLDLNETAAQHSLCKAIAGGCCVPNLKMLKDDQELILAAVERGDIDAETVQRARRRATDEQVTRCPFLGDHAECTIYAYRPAVCIQHGHGGLPKDKATTMRAIRTPGNKTIRVAELEQFACDACAKCIKPTDRIPLSVVGRSVVALVAIQQGERHYGEPRMNQFLIDNFPAS
ncbi:MAG TPA: YkgJ family cysteine cluster protein [Thermomicrobiales bacterium]|nr:YkgJ family cysteine cluster protein [Thermomicrobiales bacterium]